MKSECSDGYGHVKPTMIFRVPFQTMREKERKREREKERTKREENKRYFSRLQKNEKETNPFFLTDFFLGDSSYSLAFAAHRSGFGIEFVIISSPKVSQVSKGAYGLTEATSLVVSKRSWSWDAHLRCS